MIYLIFSILSSTLIFVVFKLFDRFQVHTAQAIVVNYLVAFGCGILLYEGPIHPTQLPSFNWWYYALSLGVLFIVIFNLMAWTTQKSGLSVVSVATKMSVVIPILFGLLYYKEHLGLLKGIGILLALIAVYLSSVKSKHGLPVDRKNILYPVLVFLGSGVIDTSIKVLEDSFVTPQEIPVFSASIFLGAAIVGMVLGLIQRFRGRWQLQFKNLLGGIALGIPNYFSIYFLVQALKSDILESSGIFTVNNVAIVMVSTLLGILIFRERLLLRNWIGVGLAIIGICLIAMERI